MEKHLEEFLIANWESCKFGADYNIYEDDDGNITGQQYPTDTGCIDILAISKDKKELLVVELEKGRASDIVVGQVLRYMGDLLSEKLVEDDQTVRGCIIARDADLRIRRALLATQNIDFYKYEVNFAMRKI